MARDGQEPFGPRDENASLNALPLSLLPCNPPPSLTGKIVNAEVEFLDYPEQEDIDLSDLVEENRLRCQSDSGSDLLICRNTFPGETDPISNDYPHEELISFDSEPLEQKNPDEIAPILPELLPNSPTSELIVTLQPNRANSIPIEPSQTEKAPLITHIQEEPETSTDKPSPPPVLNTLSDSSNLEIPSSLSSEVPSGSTVQASSPGLRVQLKSPSIEVQLNTSIQNFKVEKNSANLETTAKQASFVGENLSPQAGFSSVQNTDDAMEVNGNYTADNYVEMEGPRRLHIKSSSLTRKSEFTAPPLPNPSRRVSVIEAIEKQRRETAVKTKGLQIPSTRKGSVGQVRAELPKIGATSLEKAPRPSLSNMSKNMYRQMAAVPSGTNDTPPSPTFSHKLSFDGNIKTSDSNARANYGDTPDSIAVQPTSPNVGRFATSVDPISEVRGALRDTSTRRISSKYTRDIPDGELPIPKAAARTNNSSQESTRSAAMHMLEEAKVRSNADGSASDRSIPDRSSNRSTPDRWRESSAPPQCITDKKKFFENKANEQRDEKPFTPRSAAAPPPTKPKPRVTSNSLVGARLGEFNSPGPSRQRNGHASLHDDGNFGVKNVATVGDESSRGGEEIGKLSRPVPAERRILQNSVQHTSTTIVNISRPSVSEGERIAPRLPPKEPPPSPPSSAAQQPHEQPVAKASPDTDAQFEVPDVKESTYERTFEMSDGDVTEVTLMEVTLNDSGTSVTSECCTNIASVRLSVVGDDDGSNAESPSSNEGTVIADDVASTHTTEERLEDERFDEDSAVFESSSDELIELTPALPPSLPPMPATTRLIMSDEDAASETSSRQDVGDGLSEDSGLSGSKSNLLISMDTATTVLAAKKATNVRHAASNSLDLESEGRSSMGSPEMATLSPSPTPSDADSGFESSRHSRVSKVKAMTSRTSTRSSPTCSQEISPFDMTGMHKEEVALKKGAVGLGFCIEGGKSSPLGDRPIFVKRLFRGDAAAHGVLKPGDIILTVENQDLSEMTHFSAWNYLKSLPEGEFKLTIMRMN